MAPLRQVCRSTHLAAALTALLVVAGVAVSQSAHAATSTFTQDADIAVRDTTFAAGTGAINIRDANTAQPYPSTVAISGEPGTITDVNVTIAGFSHTAPQDVKVLLEGPQGQKVALMYNVGGTADADKVTLILDDEASTALSGSALTTGIYRPSPFFTLGNLPPPAPETSGASSQLSVFDDTDPNGTWKLWVYDGVAVDSGQMDGWALTIQRVPRTGAYPSTIDVSGIDGTVTDVDVSLTGLDHGRTNDLDVLLVGPRGQQSTLLSDAGGTSVSTGVNATFDDEAFASVPQFVGLVPSTGTWRPTNYDPQADGYTFPAPVSTGASALSAFDGTDPNGTWRLYVVDDDDAGDLTGTVSGWTLHLATTDPSPTTPPTAPPATPGSDTTAPTGTVVVNAGATRTTSTSVTLSLTADGTGSAVTGMRFSNDGSVWSAFETFASTKPWTLPGPGAGTRTVWAQFRDGGGNVSSPVSDSIVLDTVAPRVSRTRPAAGASDVRVGKTVSARLSEAVRVASVSRVSAFVQRVGSTRKVRAVVTYDAARHKIRINPRSDLRHDTTYRVTITTAVRDLAGNRLDQKPRAGLQAKRWRFTTT